ncbi:hypothetical protein [Streptomyces hydrogenans]|uniref:hypothetical protein n=1 Tax=Streptomyces hydrogenans TaxID=1873719 RepID=UPI0035DFACA5
MGWEKMWWKPGGRDRRVLTIVGLAMMAVTAAACSSGASVEEAPAYREGREMGIALREEGAWPDADRDKASSLCSHPAELDGYAGAEASDYIEGCADAFLGD